MPPALRLPLLAASLLVVAIIAVVATRPSPSAAVPPPSTAKIVTVTRAHTQTVIVRHRTHKSHRTAARRVTHRRPATPATAELTGAKAVGQLIIGGYSGPTPPPSLLAEIRAGEVGAVILMGDNTGDGAATTKAVTQKLQAAATAGGNPGLLIMTDQEGGQVSRLAGPPLEPAAEMSSPTVAGQQGKDTAGLLKEAGVNVDLAPVADVLLAKNGFEAEEQRDFGTTPSVVANAACAFANGLQEGDVAYTLKHFPGLGDAVTSTDSASVSIPQTAAELYADDLPYRRCGRSKLALVMVSSASYPQAGITGPAVMSKVAYKLLQDEDHSTAVPISDSFTAGAITPIRDPALKAINAGLDMVMYPDDSAQTQLAVTDLTDDLQNGTLSQARVRQADNRILELKRALGLR